MPSYIPTPAERVAAKYEDGGFDDQFGIDLFADGLNVNYKRKPWNPDAGRPEPEFEEDEFVAFTEGDEDFTVRNYLADAQTPSAHAEKVRHDAATTARDNIDKYGELVPQDVLKKWEKIAETGQSPTQSSWFQNVINTIDTIGEFRRLQIADSAGADEESGFLPLGPFGWTPAGANLNFIAESVRDLFQGVAGGEEGRQEFLEGTPGEISPVDYINALRGEDERVRDRLGSDLVGEDGKHLMLGSKMLEHAGWDPMEENPDAPGRAQVHNALRGIAGFGIDVFTDDLTYLSFGTWGVGKKVAMEGASHGVRRAAEEGIDRLVRGSSREGADSATLEFMDRVGRRVEDLASQTKNWDSLSEVQKQTVRQDRLGKVLATERRALRMSSPVGAEDAVRTTARERAGAFADDLPVQGSVIQEMTDPILRDLADKQFKTIAQNNPWYTSSKIIPGYSKGGLAFGSPMGRMRFPMVRVPGTETNRVASRLLGRKQISNAFDKLPEGTKTFFRRIAARTGVEKQQFEAARRGELWTQQVAENNARRAAEAVFSPESARTLTSGIDDLKESATRNGLEVSEMERGVREFLSGNTKHLDTLPDEAAATIRQVVNGTVEEGNGLRQVLQSYIDAARRVGMDVAEVQNYMPMVVSPKFSAFLDNIGDLAPDIPYRTGNAQENLGMAIMGRYLNNTGEAAVGSAGRNLAHSGFADSNKVTSVFRSGVGSEALDLEPGIARLLDDAGLERLTADQANEAVDAALELLERQGKITRRQRQSVEEAFNTNLAESFNTYIASMGEAIRFRALLRELRRVNLVRAKGQMLDVSNTLASVRGSMSGPVREWVDTIATGQYGTKSASKIVTVKAGGRNWDVPAAVAASPKFKRVVKKANSTFNRAERAGREVRTSIERAAAKYEADGYPSEIAWKLAVADGDSEFGEALELLADIAGEEARTIQTAALEMGARGMDDVNALYTEAAEQARAIHRGVEETIAEMEEGYLRKVNIDPPERTQEAIDVMDPQYAPAGSPNILANLAEMATASARRRIGKVQEHVQNANDHRALAGASEESVAKEAGQDLADRLTVANTTIDDLVEFAGPGQALRTLAEAHERLIQAGYRGIDGITDEMLEAVEDIRAIDLGTLHNPESIDEAAALAARQRMNELGEGLRGSDEFLGNIMEHLAEAVTGIADPILTSPHWRDVWAVALDGTPAVERKLFAETQAELAESGLTSATQKEITRRNAKGAMREAADDVRALWAHAANAEPVALREAAEKGPSRGRRAMDAMIRGDLKALRNYDDEFRAVVASITDRHGRPLLDPDRFVWRKDGRLVLEPEELAWVSFDDILPNIRQIAADPNLSDWNALSVVRETWETNREVVEAVDSRIGDFFRQIDAAGGMPDSLEDYDYLRRFAVDLEDTARQAEGQASLAFREGAWDDGPRLYHGARSAPPERLGSVETGGEASSNIFGPGFYTTDAQSVATTPGYGGREGGNIVEVRWAGEGQPRLLDLEEAAPQEMRDWIRGIMTAEGSEVGFYMNQRTFDDLMEALDMPDVTGDRLYTEFRDALRGFTTVEADGLLTDLNLHLSRTYDVMRHKGGVRTGSEEHLAHIWLNPDQLAIRNLTQEGQLLREGGLEGDQLNRIDQIKFKISNDPDSWTPETLKGFVDEIEAMSPGSIPRTKNLVESLEEIGTAEVRDMTIDQIRVVARDELTPILDGGGGAFREVPLERGPKPDLKIVNDLLDEVDQVMRRTKSTRSKKLESMWDKSHNVLRESLPADEFERLSNLVGLATSSRKLKPSRLPGTLRSSAATMEETADKLASDIAAIRFQTMEEGAGWSENLIEEILLFRESLEKLMKFGDDTSLSIREGFDPLAERGGEFDNALTAYRNRGRALSKRLKAVQEDRKLAAFLPEPPEGAGDIGRWVDQLVEEMDNWEPITTSVASGDYISPSLAGLVGETTRGLEMSPAVALLFENMAAGSLILGTPAGFTAAARAFREAEQWWKGAATVARPTFVPRNMFSGIIQALPFGVGARHYAFVGRNVRKFRRFLDDTGDVDAALELLNPEIRPYMKAMWEQELLQTSFSHTLDRLRPDPTMGERLNLFGPNNQLFRAGGRIMQDSEDFLRAAAFVRWYNPADPQSAQLAATMSSMIHFDYAHLTSLETKIKRFVPFFVWIRRNLPLQARLLVEHPGTMSKLQSFAANMDSVSGDTVIDELDFAEPQYLSDFAFRTPFVFDEDTPFWQRLMLDPDIPVGDLNEVVDAFQGGPKGQLEWMLRAVSPAFSTPFIAGSQENEVVAPTGLREMMMATDWLRPGEDLISGDQRMVSRGAATVFSTALPFFAEWARTLGAVPSGGNQAARAGYVTGDGITGSERVGASALSLGRAVGTRLQIPSDTRASAYEAIFEDIYDEVDDAMLRGDIVRAEDAETLIREMLAREGLTPEAIRAAMGPAG